MKTRLQLSIVGLELLCLFGASQAQVGFNQSIPDYVNTYAPVFYFHSQEKYFPQRLDTHFQNMAVNVKYAPAPIQPAELTIDNLDELNVNTVKGDGTDVYLTSKHYVSGNGSHQEFLYGQEPDPNSGASAAPATCVLADKGSGTVDVFWFLFSSFYRGNFAVADYGSHVADWAYMTMRFVDGVPQSIWLSQHQSGSAISYDAMEKGDDGVRPVVYLSNGTHTGWATQGSHDYSRQYSLPRGFAVDNCEHAILWDPIATPAMYFFSGPDGNGKASFWAAGDNPDYSPGFLNYTGIWGDKQYVDGTPGQLVLLGRHKYVDGPPGPRWRNIGRVNVCPDGVIPCTPATSLAPGM